MMKYILIFMAVFMLGCSNTKFQDNMAEDLIMVGEKYLLTAEITNNRIYYKKAWYKFKEAVELNDSAKAKMYLNKIENRMNR